MALADLDEPITVRYPHLKSLRLHEPAEQVARLLVDEAFRLSEARRPRDERMLRWFCTHPAAPEKLLLRLCDEGRFLDDLGHRIQPRSLLEKLANEHHYPEAILTLAKDLYVSADVPIEEFEKFISRHRTNTWMLESLAHLPSASANKERALGELIQQSSEKDRLGQVWRTTQLESEARTTQCADRLRELYASEEPRVWRAIAANPHTPDETLRKLAEIRTTSSARDIRNVARDNLRRKGVRE